MKEYEVVRQYLNQKWLHSEEEGDTQTETVYRPATFDFPPVKSRTGFRSGYDFNADGKCTVTSISKADGDRSDDCEWELQENGDLKVVIRFADGEAATLYVKSITKDKLVLSNK